MYNLPRIARVFIQAQSALRTINNTGGTWTNTGAKVLRTVDNGTKLVYVKPPVPIPYKTGSRSMPPGILSRKSATFALSNMPVCPSGVAGTAPDAAALFEGIFGLAGVVSAGVKVAYGFADATWLPFCLMSFAHGQSTLESQVVFGCTPQKVKFMLGGNYLTVDVSGSAIAKFTNDSFSSEDTTAKAGLTTFPVEPSSPTLLGGPIPGYGGALTIDGNDMSGLIGSVQIDIDTGNDVLGDRYSDPYPTIQVGGTRKAQLSLSLVDSDDTAVKNIKAKAASYTPVDVTLNCGTVAGNIVRFIMKQITFAAPDSSDANTYVNVAFGASDAHPSVLGLSDDLVLEFA